MANKAREDNLENDSGNENPKSSLKTLISYQRMIKKIQKTLEKLKC